MFIKDVGHNCASVAASSPSTGDAKTIWFILY